MSHKSAQNAPAGRKTACLIALVICITSQSAAQTDHQFLRPLAPVDIDATTTLTPNAYGQGVSSDQYGRAVQTDPLWRGETPSIFAPNGLVDPLNAQRNHNQRKKRD